MAFAIVPDSLVDQGFKADDWIASTMEVCGGRGGGKPGSAQGQASNCSNIDAVISAASVFSEEKVGASAP